MLRKKIHTHNSERIKFISQENLSENKDKMISPSLPAPNPLDKWSKRLASIFSKLSLDKTVFLQKPKATHLYIYTYTEYG